MGSKKPAQIGETSKGKKQQEAETISGLLVLVLGERNLQVMDWALLRFPSSPQFCTAMLVTSRDFIPLQNDQWHKPCMRIQRRRGAVSSICHTGTILPKEGLSSDFCLYTRKCFTGKMKNLVVLLLRHSGNTKLHIMSSTHYISSTISQLL